MGIFSGAAARRRRHAARARGLTRRRRAQYNAAENLQHRHGGAVSDSGVAPPAAHRFWLAGADRRLGYSDVGKLAGARRHGRAGLSRVPAKRGWGALNAEMGRYIVKVPDIGEGTTEAEIVKWHVTPGQEIREEDPLVDVMTDKATVEIPAPIAGTVVAVEGAVGEKRPVGSLLVTLDVAGAGNVAADRNTAAVPARAAGTARASPKKPLTPTLSPQAGRGSSSGAAANPL